MSSGSESLGLKGAVCAFGVFDGMHRGHMRLIDNALMDASRRGAECVCLTFDIDPDELFGKAGFKKLMSNRCRISALEDAGFDRVIELRFDEDFARMSPDVFLEKLFADGLPASIHVGSNMRYGHRAAGDVTTLEEWGERNGVEVRATNLLEVDYAPVSSTRIRKLLEAGRVQEANELLGHPYAIRAKVENGRHAGREMGIRTANLFVPQEELPLCDGVYTAYANVEGDDREYKAAVSVGVSPTFADVAKSNLEAHILDFDGDIYGKYLTLRFIARNRDMMRFESTEELVEAIEGDIAAARRLP